MKKVLLTIILLLCSFCLPSAAQEKFSSLPAGDYPVTADGLPVFTTQLAGRIDGVRLLYPEYEALSAAEVRTIKRNKLPVQQDSVIPIIYIGTVRKKSVTDVSFSPIVRLKGRYMRLVSCKIAPEQAVSAARRAQSEEIAPRYAAQSVLATGKWVKIRVREEGLYSLSATTLQSYGFSDIARVKVYGYGGRILPEIFTFSGKDALIDDLCEVPLFRRSNDVVFFAEGLMRFDSDMHRQNVYSDYSYYFVTEGSAPAELTAVREEAPGSRITDVRYTTVLDNDQFFWYEGGREMYDAYDFFNGATHSFSLPTPGNTSGKGTVSIGFSAADLLSSTIAAVSVNGQQLGSLSVTPYSNETESAREAKANFGTEHLKEQNSFTFQVTPNRHARLNYIRIQYNRRLDAREYGYAFSTSGQEGTLAIANATASTAVWRLGDGETPLYRLEGTLSDGTLLVPAADGQSRYVIVDEKAAYPAPQLVGEIENQNLHADMPADMIIIIPESGKLEEQARRLASLHRELQGLRARVVRADRLYNEFSSGTPDVAAYRRYLKMLYDRAESEADMPRFLLLFGDCLYDNRLRTSAMKQYDAKDFLLSYEKNDAWENSYNVSIGTLRAYVTDDYFGLLDDGEGGDFTREKLDLSIGRFPCHDAETARNYVDKSEHYLRNETTGFWKNQVVVIGDIGDDNMHMNDAERVASQINSSTQRRLQVKKLYIDSYTAETTATGRTFPRATEEARKLLDRGALMFNYSGHGSPSQLSKSFLLTTKDFEQITSSPLPLWIFASCEITPYDSPDNNIGRAMLDNTHGAAIAVICASRSVYSTYNNNLNIALNRYLLTPGTSFGEALSQAKNQMAYSGSEATVNKLKYVLLGNPALTLAMPQARVVVDSINGIPVSSTTDIELQACSTARFSGHIETTDGQIFSDLDGLVTGSLYDRIETVTCKNNDRAASPMTYTERSANISVITDSLTDGRFQFSIIIPRDISYTDDAACLALYAVSSDYSVEANGYTEQIHLNGTYADAVVDTISPKVFIYLNTPDFPDGGTVDSEALFVAEISDDSGINSSGNGIGKDIRLIIDDSTELTYVLNDYFSYDFGNNLSGRVEYPLTGLTRGRHTLKFRVWDINQNSTTSILNFVVGDATSGIYDVSLTHQSIHDRATFITTLPGTYDAGTAIIDVYNLSGRHLWTGQTSVPAGAFYSALSWSACDSGGSPLPAGVYLYRSRFESATMSVKSNAKKMIISR
ncbi:MAG: type IX secretion system sortase PorU [Prevotellaceae bacterium]|nr:type IX secretion system sortase PorU [Prevotellaceae bacterium]